MTGAGMYAANYKLIAEVIALIPEQDKRREMGLRFAWRLRTTNPRFSLRLFRKAVRSRVNDGQGW